MVAPETYCRYWTGWISTLTAARPKIANYPFTTLHPHLGVLYLYDKEYIMADLPGLIEGASKGVGLGHRFLGHLERCNILLHLIDGTENDVVKSYKTIRKELLDYGDVFKDKIEIVVLNKIDSLNEDEITDKLNALKKYNKNIVAISGVAKTNIEELKKLIYKIITK